VGDVIVSLDGIPTSDMGEFLTLLWSYEVGDSIQVDYLRENKNFETSVELMERP
jgi:S1-C subfamily serine protease